MHGTAKPDFRWSLPHQSVGPGAPKTRDDPRLAMVYRIAEVVMDIVGPLFWAALVLAFMTGALGIDLYH
jgi:hypothetical protein